MKKIEDQKSRYTVPLMGYCWIVAFYLKVFAKVRENVRESFMFPSQICHENNTLW
jgi:hypothetical protein